MAVYVVKNIDSPKITEATGRELMETGLCITTLSQPMAAIIKYCKK